MTAKGHMFLASSITLGVMSTVIDDSIILSPYSIIFYASVIAGSLLPDIDEPDSYIGNKLKIVSILMSSVFKHRTFTHYLITPFLMGIISFFTEDINMKIILFGLAVGILLHDAGDMLTKGGIKGFFFPFFPSSRVGLLPYSIRFKTFSIQEYMFIYFLLLPLNIYFAYQLSLIGFWGLFNEIF